ILSLFALPLVFSYLLHRPLHSFPTRRSSDLLAALAATRAEDRIMMAGTANIARSAQDFARDVEPLLDVLEEQLVLLRLFTEMHVSPGAVEVRIGSELEDSALHSTSVVGAGYGAGSHLAILGPRRMDYV